MLSRWESLTPPGRDTNRSQVSPADAGTHLPTPEGWKTELAKVEKMVAQIFKSRQSSGSNWRTLWQEGRDLINCTNHARPYCKKEGLQKMKRKEELGLWKITFSSLSSSLPSDFSFCMFSCKRAISSYNINQLIYYLTEKDVWLDDFILFLLTQYTIKTPF